MTLHQPVTAALRPIVPQPRGAIVPVPVAATAGTADGEYVACRATEAAYLARVEAGGPVAVARAAARYPFAAAFRVPAAAQDIIRDAMAASVPAKLRPKPDHSARYMAQKAERSAQIDRVRVLLADGACLNDVIRLMGIARSTARQYIMAATA